MAKSLQEQLMAAGLADKKKAKKAEKERKKQDHLQRTGQSNEIDAGREQAAEQRQKKAEQDRQLNLQKEQEREKKAIQAQIKDLITRNTIKSEIADIKYQFVDGKKIKQMYVDQAIWDRLSRGQLAIIATGSEPAYGVIPLAVADKIRQRDEVVSIIIAESSASELDEDDPYAAYQIPDDLMW